MSDSEPAESRSDSATESSKRAVRLLGVLTLVVLTATSIFGLVAALSATARVVELEAKVAKLSGEQAAISSDFGSLPEAIADLDDRVDQAVDLATTAQFGVAAVGENAQDARRQADDAYSRADSIAECVNTYMKTVGDSGGGYYRYYFC